jgi:transcriptional regulator with XRE-family HTH domain
VAGSPFIIQFAFRCHWSETHMAKSPRGVRDLDVQIGQRIKEARHAQGMAQETLANGLGITFQQVQKYENASNRVSASRLYDIANILGTPITYFYEGAEPFVRSVNRRKARTANRAAL